MNAEIVTNVRTVLPYRDRWEALYRNTVSEPSTSFGWTEALLRTSLGPDDVVHLVFLKEGSETVGTPGATDAVKHLDPLVTHPLEGRPPGR